MDLKEAPAPKIREVGSVFLEITENAKQKLLSLSQKEKNNAYLRIRISGGGCNGLSYKMKFVDAPKEGDLGINLNPLWVLVDCKSALYMRGSILDYSNNMIGGGFKFKNPNATSSCSCGESFSV